MSYLVCQISRNLTLGAVSELEDLDEAINLVVQIVEENGVEVTPEIREEIVEDMGYVDELFDWSVQIGIVG